MHGSSIIGNSASISRPSMFQSSPNRHIPKASLRSSGARSSAMILPRSLTRRFSWLLLQLRSQQRASMVSIPMRPAASLAIRPIDVGETPLVGADATCVSPSLAAAGDTALLEPSYHRPALRTKTAPFTRQVSIRPVCSGLRPFSVSPRDARGSNAKSAQVGWPGKGDTGRSASAPSCWSVICR